MVTLVESVEDDELIVLSKGLKKLEEDCRYIVPDTGFLTNHILKAGECDEIKSRMSKYIDEKHGDITLFSLIELYKDLSSDHLSSGSDENNLNEIHDRFDQSLLISDLTLDALTSLLLDGKIAVPSQAYDELDIGYNVCLKRTRIFRSIFERMMANGYTSRMIYENRREAYYFTESRKRFFREQYRDYVKDLIKNTMACMEKLNLFIGLARARNCIIEDSGLFEDPDRRIIDGAMQLEDSVGIVSCDGDFNEKTEEVARLRKSSGLKVPNVTLMFAMQDFRWYHMRTYQ